MNYKNIVTNILGLILWLLAIREVLTGENVTLIIVLILLGAALFLFKNRTLISILKKIVVLRFSNNTSSEKNDDYE